MISFWKNLFLSKSMSYRNFDCHAEITAKILILRGPVCLVSNYNISKVVREKLILNRSFGALSCNSSDNCEKSPSFISLSWSMWVKNLFGNDFMLFAFNLNISRFFKLLKSPLSIFKFGLKHIESVFIVLGKTGTRSRSLNIRFTSESWEEVLYWCWPYSTLSQSNHNWETAKRAQASKNLPD